ncbi:MAG: hypothetical protein V4714_11975, partial [Bacteroidota bacterium]
MYWNISSASLALVQAKRAPEKTCKARLSLFLCFFISGWLFPGSMRAVANSPSVPLPARTVPASDSLTLVDLYTSTDGANWFTKTNWLTGSVNTWFGVTVANGRVT